MELFCIGRRPFERRIPTRLPPLFEDFCASDFETFHFASIPQSVDHLGWTRSLPSEIWLAIFHFLDTGDIPNVALSCRLFYHLTNVNCLWKWFTFREFPSLIVSTDKISKEIENISSLPATLWKRIYFLQKLDYFWKLFVSIMQESTDETSSLSLSFVQGPAKKFLLISIQREYDEVYRRRVIQAIGKLLMEKIEKLNVYDGELVDSLLTVIETDENFEMRYSALKALRESFQLLRRKRAKPSDAVVYDISGYSCHGIYGTESNDTRVNVTRGFHADNKYNENSGEDNSNSDIQETSSRIVSSIGNIDVLGTHIVSPLEEVGEKLCAVSLDRMQPSLLRDNIYDELKLSFFSRFPGLFLYWFRKSFYERLYSNVILAASFAIFSSVLLYPFSWIALVITTVLQGFLALVINTVRWRDTMKAILYRHQDCHYFYLILWCIMCSMVFSGSSVEFASLFYKWRLIQVLAQILWIWWLFESSRRFFKQILGMFHERDALCHFSVRPFHLLADHIMHQFLWWWILGIASHFSLPWVLLLVSVCHILNEFSMIEAGISLRSLHQGSFHTSQTLLYDNLRRICVTIPIQWLVMFLVHGFRAPTIWNTLLISH